MTAKTSLSLPPEIFRDALKRGGAGHDADELAARLGRSPQTIRAWLELAAKSGVRPAGMNLQLRADALLNELLASVVSPSETRHAIQTCRDLLKLFWIVSASHPGRSPREIYRKVVMARAGATEEDAESVLVRAEQSFASWPAERTLTFGDVVHYLAVSEYLASNSCIGTRINMGRIVAGRIPRDL
jgi:hypothetical protein